MMLSEGDEVQYVGQPQEDLRPGDHGKVVVIEPDGEPVVTWSGSSTMVMKVDEVRRVNRP